MKAVAIAQIGLVLASQAWAQGSLAPPGAPAPTLKTLAQIEPRTPITNAPFTITQPGAYYLATNLSTTGHGVIVRADRVDLDLMGFAVVGDRGSGDYGVWFDGAPDAPLRDVAVRNGILDLFDTGVRAEHVQNSRMGNLLISSNRNYGIHLYAQGGSCIGNAIAGCSLSDTGTYGISLNGSASGQCNGNSISDCTIGRAGYGIWLDGADSGQCNGNSISGCTIGDTVLQGIYLRGNSSGQCAGNSISGCTVHDTGSYGIQLDGASGGRCEGNAVARCSLLNNATYGIHLTYANANRIERNHVSGTLGGLGSAGIETENSSGNLVVQNSCGGPTGGYSIEPADTYGPVVTNAGVLPTSGPPAHPWANFSR